jgi:hypothetical protein
LWRNLPYIPGVGVGLGVGLGIGSLGDGVGVGSPGDGVGVGIGLGIGVGLPLGVGLGVGVGLAEGVGLGEGVWAGAGFATSVPVAGGVVRPFATFFAGTNVHFCVAPAMGVSVNLLPLFFARSEIIVEGLLTSAPFTCNATAV